MSIDLRTDFHSGTWVRQFGEHEEAGICVSLNARSAHVTLTEIGIMFETDRQDVPTAWTEKIDVIKLRAELIATIAKRMSPKVLEELFRELRWIRASAFGEGEEAAKAAMRKALGL